MKLGLIFLRCPIWLKLEIWLKLWHIFVKASYQNMAKVQLNQTIFNQIKFSSKELLFYGLPFTTYQYRSNFFFCSLFINGHDQNLDSLYKINWYRCVLILNFVSHSSSMYICITVSSSSSSSQQKISIWKII